MPAAAAAAIAATAVAAATVATPVAAASHTAASVPAAEPLSDVTTATATGVAAAIPAGGGPKRGLLAGDTRHRCRGTARHMLRPRWDRLLFSQAAEARLYQQ